MKEHDGSCDGVLWRHDSIASLRARARLEALRAACPPANDDLEATPGVLAFRSRGKSSAACPGEAPTTRLATLVFLRGRILPLDLPVFRAPGRVAHDADRSAGELRPGPSGD